MLCGIVLLTGCGKSSASNNTSSKGYTKNTVVCSMESEPDDVSEKEEIIGEFDKDDKLTKVYGYIYYKTEEDAQRDLESAKEYYGENVELDGKKMIIKNLESNDEYLSLVGSSRESFINYAKSLIDDPSYVNCK